MSANEPTLSLIRQWLDHNLVFLFLACLVISLGILFLYLIINFSPPTPPHLHPRRPQQHAPAPAAMIRGLSKKEIRRLPRFRFWRTDPGPECVFCLERIGCGDITIKLPACSHTFHLACIDKWLVKSAVCPICRTKVSAPSTAGCRSR